LQEIFKFRKNELLSSRVRFKIQDLVDLYNKNWKQVIIGERQFIDDEGFQYRYVPKDAIINEEDLPAH